MTTASSVRSLLIPISGGRLLVPSAVVAEIFSYRDADIPQQTPEWLLGTLLWREQSVPLVSFESLLNIKPQPGQEKSRIVVLYGTQNTDILPFYAIVAKGMPNSIELKQEDLLEPKAVKRAGVVAGITYASKGAWLPDLDHIEKLLLKNTL